MRQESYEFLRQLLETASPSGYEQAVQKVVREWAQRHADWVKPDVLGNVIACLNPDGRPRVMMAGHCDQIGLMVQHIDDDGFIYVNPIGGHDPIILVGQKVTIWNHRGEVMGVISRKPIHLLRSDEDKEPPKITDLWIDIGAKSKKEAKSVCDIGDPVTFELGVRRLRNGIIVSPGLDDKMGAWVVMETLRLLSGKKFDAAVFAVSTVQEEVGWRGAITSTFGIEPDVGIAVDVTFATDHPTMEKKITGEVKLHQGPVIYRGPNINPFVYEMLVKAAKRKKIRYQLAGVSRPTQTDANAIQLSRGGVATGLISVPNRYMHSPVEVVALKDLDNAAKLLAEFVIHLKKNSAFTP